MLGALLKGAGVRVLRYAGEGGGGGRGRKTFCGELWVELAVSGVRGGGGRGGVAKPGGWPGICTGGNGGLLVGGGAL